MGGKLGWGFPDGSVVKDPPANAGHAVLIPGLGTSPGERNGNPLQYSCLGSPMDRGAWQATIYGVSSDMIVQLSEYTYDLTNPAINSCITSRSPFSNLMNKLC